MGPGRIVAAAAAIPIGKARLGGRQVPRPWFPSCARPPAPLILSNQLDLAIPAVRTDRSSMGHGTQQLPCIGHNLVAWVTLDMTDESNTTSIPVVFIVVEPLARRQSTRPRAWPELGISRSRYRIDHGLPKRLGSERQAFPKRLLDEIYITYLS